MWKKPRPGVAVQSKCGGHEALPPLGRFCPSSLHHCRARKIRAVPTPTLLQLIPTTSQMPADATRSNPCSRAALNTPGGQGFCQGHGGGHREDVIRECTTCLAEAWEKGGYPHQLPRLTALKAAHFTGSHRSWLESPQIPQHPLCFSQGRGKEPKPPGALLWMAAGTASPAKQCSSSLWMGERGEETPCSCVGSPVGWC